MSKGTPSMGKKSGKTNMTQCRRCGSHAYHMRKKVCASCNYGKASKMRSYSWQKK
ncbi:50S ribosomal protein L37e [Candidatus Woesearchaeota archaeon]|nr:50S ribosomal protein L37e [Candidatus Woesearchaeota archaeon]